MGNRKNNIFDFATGELSQDAFICWCLNWFNDDSKPRLATMSKKLINRITEIPQQAIKSVDVHRQFSRKIEDADHNKYSVKIDVLLIINKTIGVIIEDKTFSEEHDDQIYRYDLGIKTLLSQNDGKLEVDGESYELDPNNLITVFWKTGFHYDYDKAVCAGVNYSINGYDLRDVLEPYIGESDILDDYYNKLIRDLNWYVEHEDFTNINDLENEQYPQYLLMREFFPVERWNVVKGKRSEKYQVYHGSSYGRPWTQMGIYSNTYPSSRDTYFLFWRIDTCSYNRVEQPYLSLRLYEESPQDKGRHQHKYDELKARMKYIVDKQFKDVLNWKDVDPGEKGHNKESDFFNLKLGRYLNDWQSEGEKLVDMIRKLNDLFLKEIES